MISREELVKKYFEFFKKNNHKLVPSASLIPINDPTVLFTTAGMHPLIPYLSGQQHPLGNKIAGVQKCIRTRDIEETGDETHHTFFEMLGNWSFGDYWKNEMIKYSYEFLTTHLKIPKDKLAITCFKGDEDSPKDKESSEIWNSLGIPKERIVFLDKRNNWWGPAGKTGPCGPDTEMFFWKGKKTAPKKFNPEDKNWVEIWNDVFMEYHKTKSGKYNSLTQKNVDTGMGVERTLAILNNLEDNYQTSLFKPIIKEIEKISKKKYDGNEKAMRIIADHLKTSTFILGEDYGISPSNTEHGYILRRLIRRAVRYGKSLGIEKNFTTDIAKKVFPIYEKSYLELKRNKNRILKELEKEEIKFRNTLEKGLKQFEKISKGKEKIGGKEAFLLFQSYGFPIELTEELANEKKIPVDIKEFEKEFSKHQKLSRTQSAGKFKSGLADDSEATTRLHTATHMLNESLTEILGTEVKQKGSNITPERLRFDFTFSRKLTPEEKMKIEELVNKKIKEKLEIIKEEMFFKKAISSGAQGEFGHKYPEIVSVYTILDSKNKRGWFSKEICTGPHIKNTKELGQFKILKETSSSAGVRRIKAILEN